MNWVRLHHDCPTDPQWRVIAKKSGQRIGDVHAVWNFVLVNASSNANERGTMSGWESESVAAALDLEESDVDAILREMQGRVIDGSRLTAWDKRNPRREDDSSERVKAHREQKRNAVKRTVTHCNAPDTDTDTDTDKNREDHTTSAASWDDSTRAIQGYFPGTDIPFCQKIIAAAVAVAPDITDSHLARAIQRTHRKSQESAGLWLTTLPTFLVNKPDLSSNPIPIRGPSNADIMDSALSKLIGGNA